MNRESEAALLEDCVMSLSLEGRAMFADRVLTERELDRLYQMFTYELPRVALRVSEIRLAARVRARVDRCGPRMPIDKHVQSELDDIALRRREVEARMNAKRPLPKLLRSDGNGRTV